jgi:methionyl-tRNA synthetase
MADTAFPIAQTPPSIPEGIQPIDITDFIKVKLRVGIVRDCTPHPNADKLLVLKVDLGEEKPRTICAGIKAFYTPARLLHTHIIMVSNLAPRMMRGIESEGMLLAATDKVSGAVRLLTLDGTDPCTAGSEVR